MGSRPQLAAEHATGGWEKFSFSAHPSVLVQPLVGWELVPGVRHPKHQLTVASFFMFEGSTACQVGQPQLPGSCTCEHSDAEWSGDGLRRDGTMGDGFASLLSKSPSPQLRRAEIAESGCGRMRIHDC